MKYVKKKANMTEQELTRIEALDKGEYLECALGKENYLLALKKEMEKSMPNFDYDNDIELFTMIGDKLVINLYAKLVGNSDIYKTFNINPILN